MLWDEHEIQQLEKLTMDSEEKKEPELHWMRRFRILPKKPLTFFGSIFRFIFLFGFVAVLSVIGGSVYLLNDIGVFDFNTFELTPITKWKPSDNTIVYDRKENKIAEEFTNYHVYVPYDKIPRDLVHAILSIEDRTFFAHQGVDPKGMLRALSIYLKSRGTQIRQGASTLTQQVVRYFLLPQEKSFVRKVEEIFLALRLEEILTKEKILEIYTNALFLGNGAYGVGAAAKRYFDKDLGSLKLHELALLAGLFQSPSRYNPQRNPKAAKKRQAHVLNAMVEEGYLTAEEAAEWGKKPLKYKNYQPLYGEKAPYFVDYVNEVARNYLGKQSIKNQGLRIYTTLDQNLQNLAEKAIKENEDLLDEYQKYTSIIHKPDGSMVQPALESALVSVDPRTGEVLAMVGGRDYKSSKFNRAFKAMRQPGSSFKPIVYSLALSRGFRWSDVSYVTPITLAGNYRPRTTSTDYMTETTLLRAFYRSMNATTMEVGQKLGLDPIIEHARNMGINSPMKKEFGTILGASEVNLLDLAKVYSVFANDGVRVEQTPILKITDNQDHVLWERESIESNAQRVLSSQVNFLVVEGMRNVLLHGTATRIAPLSQWVVGKTGTSNEAKDNWFNGFSSDLVTISWVGCDEDSSIQGNAQGASLALPIWETYMTQALKTRPSLPFHHPEGVSAYSVHPQFGRIASGGIKMWFLDSFPPVAMPSPVEAIRQKKSIRDPFAD